MCVFLLAVVVCFHCVGTAFNMGAWVDFLNLLNEAVKPLGLLEPECALEVWGSFLTLL